MSEVAATVTTEAAPTVDNLATVETPAVTPAEIKSMKEKFMLKVDGEEFEEELDWNDKESIKNKLQLAAAAKKRIGEAKSEKQKAMEILRAFEDGTLLSKHPKGRELAEKLLLEQIQDEMMDPKDKEIRDLKKYKEGNERTEKEKLEAGKKEAASKAEFKIAQDFQNTIIEALNKSGLPKTPDLVKRAAFLMSKNLDYGLTLSADDLVTEMKGEYSSLNQSIIKDMDAAQLVAYLGKDKIKQIRMFDLKSLQESQQKVMQKGSKSVQESKEYVAKGYETQEEYRERINKRMADLK